MSPTFDPYSSQPEAARPSSEQLNSELPVAVQSHLVKAILSTCLCFVPLGIVAIVFASQVNVRLEYGDQAGAIKASRQANFYGNLSIGLGVLSYIMMIVMVTLALIAGSNAKTG
jgi:uncharacterized membrane protein